jgi:hypothetical protein
MSHPRACLACDITAAEDDPGGRERRRGVEGRDPDCVSDQCPVCRCLEWAVPGVQLVDEDVGACAFDRRQRGESLQGERVEDRADDAGDALPGDDGEEGPKLAIAIVGTT